MDICRRTAEDTVLNADIAPLAPEQAQVDLDDAAHSNIQDFAPRERFDSSGEGRTIHDYAADSVEELLLAKLDDDKAQDVVVIDLKDKSSVADTLVVASGRSHRHVGAMADHLLRALKEAGHGRARVEGLPACDWVLIDAGDVIVHLFRPEVRSFYAIEKIWSVDSPHRLGATG